MNVKRSYYQSFNDFEQVMPADKRFKKDEGGGYDNILPPLSLVIARALQYTSHDVQSMIPVRTPIVNQTFSKDVYQQQDIVYRRDSGLSVLEHVSVVHPEPVASPIQDSNDSSTDVEDNSQEASSDGETPTSPNETCIDENGINMNPNTAFDFNQLQPIRILAYQIGLSSDSNKSWRYRDIKRCLFHKVIQEHLTFIEQDSTHKLLKTRLPHKLNLVGFCRRLMLLVFHYVVRDGCEPKFFRRKGVNQNLVKDILQTCDPTFFKKISVRVAKMAHLYVSNGMPIDVAIQKATSNPECIF
ncbi:TPR and ankyrin repeat-containing protein [Acrasis kona]|uniref:TPR and ankyrin repeat-containing protein n=1 Tax=Acrasis kona TaxID=1008807 RepID=A0AAW2ZKB6_9EUKA